MTFMDKLREVKAEVDTEQGGIVLFAVLEREDPGGKFDIIFSASWIKSFEDESQATADLLQKLQRKLAPRDLVPISRVISFHPGEELVVFILDNLLGLGGRSHLDRFTFNGIAIARSDILAADLTYGSIPALPPNADAMSRQTAAELEAVASR